ncbi:MAG: lysozyme [Cyanobacteria bacterium J06643_13]
MEQKPKQEPIPEIAVNLIKEFEGFKDYAYIDTDGTPVIGYGLSRINGVPVRIGDRITPSEADSALDAHLQEIQQELAKVVKVELTEQQLSALASISFNVGVGAIKNSTLLRKINAQDYAGAANEFLRWDKANMRGRLVQLPGLSRRRAAERNLFLQNS